jgi:hypothetical protein
MVIRIRVIIIVVINQFLDILLRWRSKHIFWRFLGHGHI